LTYSRAAKRCLDAWLAWGAWAAPAIAQGETHPASRPADAAPTLQSALFGDALDEWRLRFFGHVEGSYTYNPADPAGDVNTLRFFDQRANQALLNQASLTLERPVEVKPEFDLGFRASAFVGSDAPYILNDGISPSNPGPFTPEIQVAMTELYADAVLPWGRGVRVRAGEVFTPIGFESVDPTKRPLYSSSFQFVFAQPYTQTGIFADVPLDEAWTLTAAAIRGYGFPTTPYADRPMFLGGATYAPTGGGTTVAVMVLSGDEEVNDQDLQRSLLDVIVTQKLGGPWSIAVNLDYAYGEGAAPGGGAIQYYGVAGYVKYEMSTAAAWNVRLEAFDDDDGTQTGVRAAFYEATAGLTWTPFAGEGWLSNLTLRPEVRLDYATKPAFDGFTEQAQFTAALEILFRF
jgi:hypothetical protein